MAIAKNHASTDKEHIYNCQKHGQLTLAQCIKAGLINNRQRYKCKQCHLKIRKNNYVKNKTKILSRCKSYKEKDPDRYREIKNKSARKQYLVNKEKRRPKRQEWERRSRERLDDRYVKHELTKRCGLNYNEVPQELIDFKKLILQLKRKIKSKINESKMTKSLEKLENVDD